jgi:hypothetical protein
MKKTDCYEDWKPCWQPWKVELEFLMATVHTAEELKSLFENIPNSFLNGAYVDVTSIEVANKAGTIQMSFDYSDC